jgi:hypothetical protein
LPTSNKENRMKTSHRTAAGAAALLAAGIVGIGSADAASAATPQAKADRITSTSQLKSNIAQAVALEKAGSTAAIGTHPAGVAASVPDLKAACSATSE